MSPGIDLGIREAVQARVVTSVSCLIYRDQVPNLPRFFDGKCGVHLRLTDGLPVKKSGIDSLVDDKGCFPRERAELNGNMKVGEVREEWLAQIELFRDSGIRPTHIDTHHHVHARTAIAIVYAEIAKELGLAVVSVPKLTVNLKTYDLRCTEAYYELHADTQEGDLQNLANLLEAVDTIHVATHPGHAEPEVQSQYIERRDRELDFLLSASFKEWLRKKEVRLIGMNAL